MPSLHVTAKMSEHALTSSSSSLLVGVHCKSLISMGLCAESLQEDEDATETHWSAHSSAHVRWAL